MSPGAATVTQVHLGFLPLDAVLCRTGPDTRPVLAAMDGSNLVIASLDRSRETRMRWAGVRVSESPGRHPPSARGNESNMQRPGQSLLAAADEDSDRLPELLVLTNPQQPDTASRSPAASMRPFSPTHPPPLLFDTLRCIDVRSGEERWKAGAGSAGLPGPMVSVCVARTRTVVAGPGWVVSLGSTGRRLAVSRFPGEGRSIFALRALGTWPIAVYQCSRDVQTFRALSPGLAATEAGAPGYNGVRIQALLPLRLDGDTLQDLVVLRTAADAALRLDVFVNGLGSVERELAAATENARQAALRHDGAGVARALRRVRLLDAEVAPGASARAEEFARRLQRRAAMRTRATAGAVAVLVLAVAVFAVLVFRRRAQSIHQIENEPLELRVALASDLVAMDHNFVSKGNYPAAVERLKEIRQRYGLGGDRDLSQVSGGVEPHYTSVISRLIDETPTIPVLELFGNACRRAARGARFDTADCSRDNFRRTREDPGLKLVCIRSVEYPDIFRRLRWLAAPPLRNVVEHLVVDHFRYARSRATILLEYIVNTQWNRKLVVRFLSDSRQSIDFSGQEGHLVSELTELAIRLRPAIEVPGPDFRPSEPDERLWLKVADFVSVLEETRERLRRRA